MCGRTSTWFLHPNALGATAVYNASGLAYYRHSDWLGSSRLASTPSRTVHYGGAYAPYGENYAEWQVQDRNFTGQNQDMISSGPYPLYDFLYREYHPTWGRWVSPDPAGLGAVDPGNPQSWNRYAYVLNNPTSLTDPLGLMCTQEGCEGGGGSIATDPSDPCAYLMTNDASCQEMPGLWPNGDPIYGGPGVNIDVGGWGGGVGGGVWNEAVPPFGGGGFGLPCDFGTCGPGMPSGNGFLSIGDVLPWGGIIRTTTWACGLNPAACVAAGLAGADVALLGWDVYQGYRLAQAYGYLLPNAHLAKGGNQNVGHDYIRDEARKLAKELGISYCQALQMIYNAARAAGNSKKAIDTKATQKQDGCRGH